MDWKHDLLHPLRAKGKKKRIGMEKDQHPQSLGLVSGGCSFGFSSITTKNKEKRGNELKP